MEQTQRNWLRSPVERVGTLADAALPPPADAGDDIHLVRALRERDEAAFERLLDQLYTPMLRVAWTYVRTRDEAEEVVQDTWLAVLAGLDRFEHRSSLTTWIFRILVNRARTRAKREARSVPVSSLSRADMPAAEHHRPAASAPAPRPDEALLAAETRDRIDEAIRALAPRQRLVITLRDVLGWPPDEVCTVLDISDANQRILLHRARSRVREALVPYLAAPD